MPAVVVLVWYALTFGYIVCMTAGGPTWPPLGRDGAALTKLRGSYAALVALFVLARACSVCVRASAPRTACMSLAGTKLGDR